MNPEEQLRTIVSFGRFDGERIIKKQEARERKAAATSSPAAIKAAAESARKTFRR